MKEKFPSFPENDITTNLTENTESGSSELLVESLPSSLHDKLDKETPKNEINDFSATIVSEIIENNKTAEPNEINSILEDMSQKYSETFFQMISNLRLENNYQKETLAMRLAEHCVTVAKLAIQQGESKNGNFIHTEISQWLEYEQNKYKELLGREKNINNSAEIFLDTIKKQIKLQLNSYLLENLNQYSTEIDAKARLYWTGYLAIKEFGIDSKEFNLVKKEIEQFMRINNIQIPEYWKGFFFNKDSRELYELFSLMSSKDVYQLSVDRKKYYGLYINHACNKLLLRSQSNDFHIETEHEKIIYANVYKPESSGIPNDKVLLETDKITQVLFEINRLNKKYNANMQCFSIEDLANQEIDFNNPIIAYTGNYEHYFVVQYMKHGDQTIACVIDSSFYLTENKLDSLLKTSGGKADHVIYGRHDNLKLQHSGYGCSTFALKNALTFLKNKETMERFISKKIDLENNNVQPIPWTQFPPEILKTAQSMSLINNSEQNESTLQKIKKTRKSTNSSHVEINEGKKEQNMYINNHIKKSKERFAKFSLSHGVMSSQFQLDQFLKYGKQKSINAYQRKNKAPTTTFQENMVLSHWRSRIEDWSQFRYQPITENFRDKLKEALKSIENEDPKKQIEWLDTNIDKDFYNELIALHKTKIKNTLEQLDTKQEAYTVLQELNAELNRDDSDYIGKYDKILKFYSKNQTLIHNDIQEFNNQKNQRYEEIVNDLTHRTEECCRGINQDHPSYAILTQAIDILKLENQSPQQKIKGFYESLNDPNQENKVSNLDAIKKYNSNATSKFIAAIAIIAATLCTGILPGLLIIGIVSKATNKSPLDLLKSNNLVYECAISLEDNQNSFLNPTNFYKERIMKIKTIDEPTNQESPDNASEFGL